MSLEDLTKEPNESEITSEDVRELRAKLRAIAKRNSSEYLNHVRYELSLIHEPKPEPTETLDRYADDLVEAVLELSALFALQEHSGMSSKMTLSLFKTAVELKPLSPLTGKDDEWIECGTGVWHNTRNSSVFKEDGRAYDIEGYAFLEEPVDEETGKTQRHTFTSKGSRRTVKFPYTHRDMVLLKVPVNSSHKQQMVAVREYEQKHADEENNA